MDYLKCKLCRDAFFSYGSPLCPKCQEQIDKDFIAVREYIYNHPHQANLEKIAEATGVSEKNIIYLLEEERLSASGDLVASVGRCCRICGRNITAGSICEPCKTALTKDLSGAASVLSEKKPAKATSTVIRGANRDFYSITEYGKKNKN